MTVEEHEALINQRIAEAVADQQTQHDAELRAQRANNRAQQQTNPQVSVNRTARAAFPVAACNYKLFKDCGPKDFEGTEEPEELLQWFVQMEKVIRISACAPEDRIKFATSSLQKGAADWWNTYA